MKNIKKGIEPKELTDFKTSRDFPNYSDLGQVERDAIREALISEQKGLCAFCMGRIENKYQLGRKHPAEGEDDGYNIKIAHWLPQSEDSSKSLDYNNMLGACKGGGRKIKYQHCDKKQADKSLIINPIEHDCEKLISYGLGGEIICEHFDKDINDTLNLNVEKLQIFRQLVMEQAKEQLLILKTNKTISHLDIVNEVKDFWQQPDENNLLREYCQAAIYYLDNYGEMVLDHGA